MDKMIGIHAAWAWLNLITLVIFCVNARTLSQAKVPAPGSARNPRG